MYPTHHSPLRPAGSRHLLVLLRSAQRGQHDALHHLVDSCRPTVADAAERHQHSTVAVSFVDQLLAAVETALAGQLGEVHTPEDLTAWLSRAVRDALHDAADDERHDAVADVSPASPEPVLASAAA